MSGGGLLRKSGTYMAQSSVGLQYKGKWNCPTGSLYHKKPRGFSVYGYFAASLIETKLHWSTIKIGLGVLLLSATAYIGRDALFTLVQAHPDYDIACFIRNGDKGPRVARQYASVRLMYGILDDGGLLEQDVRNADSVLSTSYDFLLFSNTG